MSWLVMSCLVLRRSSEYLVLQGPREVLDEIFLKIADEGWVPWTWRL